MRSSDGWSDRIYRLSYHVVLTPYLFQCLKRACEAQDLTVDIRPPSGFNLSQQRDILRGKHLTYTNYFWFTVVLSRCVGFCYTLLFQMDLKSRFVAADITDVIKVNELVVGKKIPHQQG